MRGDVLLDNLAFIDPDLVASAEVAYGAKRRVWMKSITLAACLVLIIAASIAASQWFLPLVKGDPNTPIVIENINIMHAEEPYVQLIVNEVASPISTDRVAYIILFDDPNEQQLVEFQDFIGISFDDFMNRIPSSFSFRYCQAHHIAKTDDNGVIKAGDLESYYFFYQTENNGKIGIAISSLGEPQRDAFFLDNSPRISYIEDTSLIIRKNSGSFWVQFEYDGIYYDIETTDVTQRELTELLLNLILYPTE